MKIFTFFKEAFALSYHQSKNGDCQIKEKGEISMASAFEKFVVKLKEE